MSVRVSSWVWEHAPASGGDLLMLLALADHARDDGGGAYPSVKTLAKKMRMTRRGAQLALRRLEGAGLILPDGTGPRGTVSYCLPMNASSPGANPASPPMNGSSPPDPQEFTPRGELSDTAGANGGAPEPSVKPSSERHPPPQQAGEPVEPEGNRRRDRERYERELAAWAPCGGGEVDGHSPSVVQEILDEVGKAVSSSSIHSWLIGAHLHRITEGGLLVIGVHADKRAWVQDRFGTLFVAAAKAHGLDVYELRAVACDHAAGVAVREVDTAACAMAVPA